MQQLLHKMKNSLKHKRKCQSDKFNNQIRDKEDSLDN
jgi:hypothetical protein